MSTVRSSPALFLLVAGLTACSTGNPPKAAVSSPTPSVAPTSAAAGCADAIDHTATPPDDNRVVAESVAVPTAERLLQAEPHSPGDGPTRMFAKWGLLIRTGTSATLSLAPEWSGRARLGWGGSDPVTTISATACPHGSGAWTVFAGGTWVSEADCVPIHVDTGKEQVTVEISVGAPCDRPGGLSLGSTRGRLR